MPSYEIALKLVGQKFPIVLTAGKNPGVFGRKWGTRIWTPEQIDVAFRQFPKLNIGLKLGQSWGGYLDIEADGDQAAEDAERFFEGNKPDTIGWKSARGHHALFRLTDPQFAMLRHAGASAIHKYGELEFRGLTEKTVISLIPPSKTDGFRRKWIGLSLVDRTPIFLPDRLFERLLDSISSSPKESCNESKRKPARLEHPGDFYNRDADWREILCPLGWTIATDFGDVIQWYRPGKTDGSISATTGYCATELRADCFYVFSTSPEISPFKPGKTYSKFETRAIIDHRILKEF